MRMNWVLNRCAIRTAFVCATLTQAYGQEQAAPAAPTGPAAATSESARKITRIGVALPKTQMAQASPGGDEAERLRVLESKYLQGPGTEVVSLTAMLPSQIVGEAKDKKCDWIVYSTLTEKANTSGGFLKKAMPFASMVPMVGALGSSVGAVAGATVAMAASSAAAAGLAGEVHARSEMTFSYQLVSANDASGAPKLNNTYKAKAKQDGQDIISPMIEQQATAIFQQFAKVQ